MNRIELMQASQMYMVMIVGIRQYQQTRDMNKFKNILSTFQFNGEMFSYVNLYRGLLEDFISGNRINSIEQIIGDIHAEPYLYEDVMMKNFEELRECEEDALFLTTLKSQLQGFAYSEIYDNVSYDEHAKIVIDHMLSKKLLYSSMIYKYNGIILNEKFIFLKPVLGTLELMRQKQLIL